MFSDINAESTRKLTEAKSLLNLAKEEQNGSQLNLNFKIYKGTFFVLLYGALEYTVTALVQRCISILNEKNCNILELKPALYSLIFNDECNAIMDAKNKKWTKRYALFSQIGRNKICSIEDTLFPTSTGNIKAEQIDSIWKTFGIAATIFNAPQIKGKLSELADNRNKVAHGRELASAVGGHYSITDIENIYNDISAYCSYIIFVFEDYINNEDYLIH